MFSRRFRVIKFSRFEYRLFSGHHRNVCVPSLSLEKLITKRQTNALIKGEATSVLFTGETSDRLICTPCHGTACLPYDPALAGKANAMRRGARKKCCTRNYSRDYADQRQKGFCKSAAPFKLAQHLQYKHQWTSRSGPNYGPRTAGCLCRTATCDSSLRPFENMGTPHTIDCVPIWAADF